MDSLYLLIPFSVLLVLALLAIFVVVNWSAFTTPTARATHANDA